MPGKRVLLGVAALAFPAVAQLFAGPGAEAAGVTTLYYSVPDAPDYVAQIEQAAANWNAAVPGVRLAEGGPATIVFHETDDGAGSSSDSDGHGHGQISLDRQQVVQGFAAARIAAHELGHVLGLADDYNGPCAEVMSGHGPGTACTNAVPDAAEAAQVQRDWAHGLAAGPERRMR